MIRLGLIGCGTWGWRYIPAAIEAGNAQVVAYAHASSVPESARSHLAGLRHFDSWHRMLNETIDAFIVATPPQFHEGIAVEILGRRLPVMMEKPMALSLASAKRIAAASWATGAPLLVNHQHLFAPAYEELRDRAIDLKRCGFVSRGGGNGPDRDYSALWDYGPHDVAMALGLIGSTGHVVDAHQDGGSFRVSLSARYGAGTISVWNDGPKRRSLVCMGETEDILVYDDLDPSGIKLRRNGLPVLVDAERPLPRAVRAFAEAVDSGGGDWRFDPVVGVNVTSVLEQAHAMIKENGRVNK